MKFIIIESNEIEGYKEIYEQYRTKWRKNPISDVWEIYTDNDWVVFDKTHEEMPEDYWKYENRLMEVKNEPKKITFDEAPVLPTVTVKTMDFPIDSLPIEAKNLTKAVHESLDLPYEFIGIPVLIALSTAIGAHFEVAINKTLTSKVILFACVIASAGSGKSPCQKIAMKPIYDYQNKKFDEYELSKEEYHRQKKEYDNKKKEKKGKSAKGFGGGEEVEKDLKEPKHPRLNQIYSDDATTEALAIMLDENKHGIVLIQDEFMRFYLSIGGYKQSKGGGGDLQKYLSLWNGTPIKINRVGRSEPIILKEPFVNILGAMTPSSIEKICEDDNDENGFLDRFLFSFPTDNEMMSTDFEGIDSDIEEGYEKLIHRLIDMDVEKTVKVFLTDEARKIYFDYEKKIIKEAGSDDNMRSIFAKIKFYSLRLALIIHMCDKDSLDGFGLIKNVSLDAMKKGIQLAEYFKSQQLKIYQNVLEMKSDKYLAKAIKFIKEKGNVDNKIGKRELSRCLRLNSEEMKPVIKELIDRKIIKVDEGGDTKKSVYHVNPKTFE